MDTSNGAAIKVRSLRKTYQSIVAVDDVSFDVECGSVFCLIGPNGAGKTTIIECIEGLRRADSGSILVAGLHPIEDHTDLVHRIGAQLQETGIPPRMKAKEALRLFSSLYSRSIPLSELTAELGLGRLYDKRYGSLSGGEKRRVNIALALVGDPEIVLLDEPTTGLDPESRFRFWEYMRRLNARGKTIVTTTHYLEEAREHCDTVLMVSGGRVKGWDSPERLIAAAGLKVRVLLPRNTLEDMGEDDLRVLAGVERVRTTETNLYAYGDERVLGSVSERLSLRGVSPSVLEARPVNLEDIYLLAVGQEESKGGG